ncbi:MAG: hypothetical protein Q4B93_05185 [Clostridia bacterium]|nr:hypothetical protein [Clostridia bacterium]
MREKEKLWKLINGFLDGYYDVKTFCEEFNRVYDLEINYNQLTREENEEFGDLCEMAGRFSDDKNELKIPHMYFSEKEILCKVKKIKKMFRPVR